MFVLKKLFRYLAREDRENPSDVHLWWGGEPNRDIRYALFTLVVSIIDWAMAIVILFLLFPCPL